MPLTRRTVTAASRIMLPTYPLFSLALGCNLLFAPEMRLQSPAYTAAKSVMPLESWGVVFVMLASIIMLGLVVRSRAVVIMVLCYGVAVYALWAGFYFASIIMDPATSFMAPVWPLFVAVAHSASVASLLRREEQP